MIWVVNPCQRKPFFMMQADRAAKGVEAEDRIVREYIGSVDGLRRNEIPIDRVAENFIDADAVLIDGEALRRALPRRGNKAAIEQILRERIAVDINRHGTGDLLLQGIGHILRIGAGEIRRRHALHHARNVVAIFAAARQR